MKYCGILAVLSLILAVHSSTGFAQEMEVIFSDDFSGYEDGEMLTAKWSAFSGHWFVKDGTLHQDHGSFDYGIVARDLYLRCDYRIEAKVRLVRGGSGAGLYWNVYDALTGETGNMLRYDGEFPIMYGWMRGKGFVGTGGATGNLQNDGKWHTMRMDVNNSSGTFDFYWDGKKIVDGALSFHRSGYAGLQCSLGYCEFDDFKISVRKGTDWRASPRGVVKPEWIQSLAVMPDGNIVYPVRNMHRIQVVTPDGRLVREFGEFGEKPGQLNLPTAVAVDGQGRIYVTESGNNRVQVFSSRGKSLKVLAPGGENALKHPFGLAVSPEGKVWVGDTNNNRIVELGPDGKVAAQVGSAGNLPGQFNKLGHISYIGGKIYAADSNNRRIQVFEANLTAEPEIIPIGDGIQPSSVAHDGKGTFVVAAWRGIATFDKQWLPLKKYMSDAAGEVWPYQAVFDKKGNIVIGDWWNHRILIVSRDLTPVKPELTSLTSTSAVAGWTTDLPTPTRLMLLDTPQGSTWPSSVDYSKARAFGDGKLRTNHHVELDGFHRRAFGREVIQRLGHFVPLTGHLKTQQADTRRNACLPDVRDDVELLTYLPTEELLDQGFRKREPDLFDHLAAACDCRKDRYGPAVIHRSVETLKKPNVLALIDVDVEVAAQVARTVTEPVTYIQAAEHLTDRRAVRGGFLLSVQQGFQRCTCSDCNRHFCITSSARPRRRSQRPQRRIPTASARSPPARAGVRERLPAFSNHCP